MRVFEIIASGIGKVWSFATSIVTICLVGGIAVFGLTVFMPDNVVKAIEIFTSLLRGV